VGVTPTPPASEPSSHLGVSLFQNFLLKPHHLELRLTRRYSNPAVRSRSGYNEVVAFNAYHIAPSLLLADNVHVIVDCGPNIGIPTLFLAAHNPGA
jgi:hypothetical protein